MKPPPFEYHCPTDVDEALELLGNWGDDCKIIAGGQSLMPLLAFRLTRPKVLVDINRLPLADLNLVDGTIQIQALVRQRFAEKHAPSPVSDALHLVAHPAIRNRGTVVGSMCHADPAAELPAVALALDAVFEVQSRAGSREIHAADFFHGPLMTALQPHELVTAVRLNEQPGWRWRVIEVSRRTGDFALVGVVAGIGPDLVHGRVVVFGAAPVPYVVTGRIDELPDVAGERANPAADLHASVGYRRTLVNTLTRRALVA